MRRLLLLFTLTLLYGCSSEKGITNDVSEYARIIDEQLNVDLQIILLEDDTILMQLNNLMNEAITTVVEKSGGYNQNGKLINGEETGLGIKLLSEVDFNKRLHQQIENIRIYPKKYEYIKSGLYFLTGGTETEKFKNLKLSEVFIQLTIAHNRIITASLINENTASQQ